MNIETLNYILYNVNDLFWVFIQVLSALSTIIAIIEFLKTKKGVILKLFVMLFTILVFAVSCYSRDLTAAPDLIGKYYSDACRLITDAGLKYEPMSVS